MNFLFTGLHVPPLAFWRSCRAPALCRISRACSPSRDHPSAFTRQRKLPLPALVALMLSGMRKSIQPRLSIWPQTAIVLQPRGAPGTSEFLAFNQKTPFDLKFTSREVTAWGGLALLKRLLDGMGFKEAVQSWDLPQPGSSRGYRPVPVKPAQSNS